MKNKLLVGGLIVGLMFTAACGGSSSGSGSSSSGSSSPSITTISALPTATSPMAASASAMVAKDAEKAATTGLNMLTTSSASFSASTSIGACNTFNGLKDGFTSAAQADMILCFVKQMDSVAKFTGLTDSHNRAIDIYDGVYHIFNLNFGNVPASEGPPDRIKMKIVKDSAGNIASFEMFMCREKRDGSGLEQSEYTKQEISGTSYTMNALGNFQDAQGSGSHQVDVTGTMNSSGKFTSKTIAVKNTGSWGGASNWGEATSVQTPGAFTLSGYHKGGFSDPVHNVSGTYEDKVYALGQMLGDATGLTSLAMGDGAISYRQTGTNPNPQTGGTDTHTQSGTDAWLGDTAAPVFPVTDSAYYASASAGTLPIAQSSLSIAFSAGQTWNCSDDVGVGIVDMPVVSFTDIRGACSNYMFNNVWINCFQQVGMCNRDNMCQDQSGAAGLACENCFPNGLKDSNTGACLRNWCNRFPWPDGQCLPTVGQKCP